MKTATGAPRLPWTPWRLFFRSCLRCWYSSDTLHGRETQEGKMGFIALPGPLTTLPVSSAAITPSTERESSSMFYMH